jgi:hypothetical protein
MPTKTEDANFAEVMKECVDEVKMSDTSLDNAIEWISNRLSPDEVFDEKQLTAWAEANGFIKE